MSVNNNILNKLGNYIEAISLKVGDNKTISVNGINIEKGFVPTVANMTGIDTSKYKLVPRGCFACNLMHVGRDITIPIAYNHSNEQIAVSPAYYVFRIKDSKSNEVSPEYLEMIFSRNEFGRLAWFHTAGSVRGNLPETTFHEILIPIPSLETQQELVDIYKGLKALAEQNEALIEPLSKACDALVADCKDKYPKVQLGEHILEYDKRNSDNAIKLVKSVSVTKEFKETNAKVNKNELSGYKIVPPLHIAYVQTTKNEKCFANALNTSSDNYVVSQVDRVIYSKDLNTLDIHFLHLIFRSKEFDRYAIFNSWGSARETFDWEELCRVSIPLPPIEVQRSIANLYHCLEEAKKIASEAREKLKTLCPALVQRAANS